MKTFIRTVSVFLAVFFLLSMCACVNNGKDKTVSVTVNNEPLSDEYIGYFLYVAKLSMLSEAGYNDENSTEEDIETYWKTTEIEGENAIDVARDIAVNNAVSQKVQYLKSLEEGLDLNADEIAVIEQQLSATTESNGGEKEFSKTLADMGTNFESYKQIVIENTCISKLYELYESQGKLEISDAELSQYTEANADTIPMEMMYEYAKKDKFNSMAKQWEKEYDIIIDDDAVKNLNI